MTIITIQGQEMNLISGTQSDGRCFSASIFFDLNGKVAGDEELNVWIQEYIINPILQTEKTDCSQFLLWSYIWAGLHNTSTHATTIERPVPIPDKLGDIAVILEGLKTSVERLKSIIPPPSGTMSRYISLSEEKDLFNKLLIPDIISLKEGMNARGSHEFDTIFEDINNMIFTAKDNLEEIPTDTISRVSLMEINQPIIDYFIQLQNQICENYRNNAENNEGYNSLVNPYKQYISLLNTPQEGKDGRYFYEWTEPNAGPLDILLTQPIISSIIIYSTIDNKFSYFLQKSPLNTNKPKYNLYLYYADDHYQPLDPPFGISQPPPDSLLPTLTAKSIVTPVKTDIDKSNPKPVNPKLTTNKLEANVIPPADPKLTSKKSKSEAKPVQPVNTSSSDTLKSNNPRGQGNSIPTESSKPVKPISSEAKNIPAESSKNVNSNSQSVTAAGPPTSPSAPPIEVQTTIPVIEANTTSEEKKSEEKKSEEKKSEEKKSEEKKSEEKEADKKKKDEKIPNSLIIYIKTRIPNFYKVNYEPYMSVPKSKSHTVYFDPLIKYYEGPIKNLPSGAPKDALVTQFFEASEFDSMLNRILSDFRYMQKPRTFQESYDEHIIENNLRITLKNLFRTNNLFYINKKPYTIVSVKSNPSDWQIDKKPLEKLLNQFSHLSVKQLEQEATKEEDDIPEILRQGNVASTNISESENISVVAAGLKQAADNKDSTTLKKDISGMTDSFIPKNELPGVSEDIIKLLSKYLRKNNPINYSNNVDLARDPLTLSLLVDPNDLLKFINTNKKSSLIDLYSAFTGSKVSLNKADESYIEACVNLGKYKKEFDDEVVRIVELIRSKTNVDRQDLMLKITQLKIGYIQKIFEIADIINKIYEEQYVYFVSTKALLEELKKDYFNIIKYYEKPELALKCIEYDIVSFSSLIEEDSSNPSSVSYFTNYKKFKQLYDDQLYKNREELLRPRINFSDEAKIYMSNPNILQIEKEQYELYNFKMFLVYSYNQFDIWVNLFRSLELFIREIGNFTSKIILVSDSEMEQLNKSYPLNKQNDILKEIEAEGIMAEQKKSIYPYDQYTWHLVKNDGSNAIDTKNPNQVYFEKVYIGYVRSSVKAYDAIILYIYLLEILCLRQTRVYVAEENVNQLNLEFSLTLGQYYELIIQDIRNNKSYIPNSILWDTTKFTSIEFMEDRKKTNDNHYIIYRARIKSISESRENLVSSCEEISKIITPNISKTGFIQKCNEMITTEISNTSLYTFRSSWWLKKTIENYDIQTTDDFIYNMNKVVKDAWYDSIIEDISVNSYLDWMVFDNAKDKTDSLYATVADGLNGQLMITNSETTNPYTVEINGKRLFTFDTIKQLVIDHNTEQIDLTKYESLYNIVEILETTLKIKFIIFRIFEQNSNEFVVGDIVLYKKRPYRLLSEITDDEGYVFYNLYNGYEEIKVPERKVKIDPNNYLRKFRLYCGERTMSPDIVFTDYMYIVLTDYKNEDKTENKYKFRLVHDTNIQYIINDNEIPIYIKYFMFNSCPELNEEKLIKMGFGQPDLQREILYFETQRRDRIGEADIREDIKKIDQKIKRYTTRYDQLNAIQNTDKTLEQQAEQLLYKEEIKDLKQRQRFLEEFLTEFQTETESKPESMAGGAATLRPSEQYSYQYNPLGYPLNPNMPANVIYMPQQGYPYQNSYYTRQQRVPYNVSQNKAKDQKSKLSFYITIELELFPGTSANMLQKSIVKCQSTFERIREAWADIFGFEYRPAPMNEAYAYNLQKVDNKKNKTEKKMTSKNNKTRKLKTRK
jgi:hypothetical protein